MAEILNKIYDHFTQIILSLINRYYITTWPTVCIKPISLNLSFNKT